MEKPSWAPLVLGGAVPRGATDTLAILTIGMIGLESGIAQGRLASLPVGLWFLFVSVPPVAALASLSDTARKLREELALFAYGGSSWQVWVRYFLRGVSCTLLAISPFLYIEYATLGYSLPLTILSAILLSTVGGASYSTPSLTRIRSTTFAENYKG